MSSNKIILKRSSVAGKKPTADQLDYGEISLNYADGEVYYKTNKNEVKALGEQYAADIKTLNDNKIGRINFSYGDDVGEVLYLNVYRANSSDAVYVPRFTGATKSSLGKCGLVPAPKAGDNTMFLRGDGKWATLTPTFDNEGNRISGYVRSVQLGNGGNGVISIEVADGQGLATTTGTNFAATAKSPGMVAVGDNITLDASTHAISLTKENVVAALGYTPPETGATYSAGTGLALDASTNTFSNSGVRSVVSTSNNSFEVDTGGTKTSIVISNVPSANQATMDAKGNVFTDTYATIDDIKTTRAFIGSNSSAIAENSQEIASLKDLSSLTTKGLGVIDDIAKKVVAASEPDWTKFAFLSGADFTGSVTIPTLTVTERVKLPTIIEQDTEITESRTISNMSVSTHYVELGDNVTVTVDDDATWVIK